MSIVTRTKTYAVCPSCGEDGGEIDHLLGTKARTSWYCDACGQEYALDFSANGNVDITVAKGRKIATTDLLMLPPQTQPVYFVVQGMRFIEKRHYEQDEHAGKEFFYEEHSCPTNWLKPEMVYCDGDSDPHGLIRFVSHVDSDSLPPDEMVSPNDHDAALIAFIEKHRS